MDIRSVTDQRLTIGDYFRKRWYFETILEKAILVVLSSLGAFKLLEWGLLLI